MARTAAEFRDVHGAAARFEPRLSRAFLKAAAKVRGRVSINALAIAIAAKDVKVALALLPKADLEDALSPAGAIVRDATLKGGRLGAERLNKVREGQ